MKRFGSLFLVGLLLLSAFIIAVFFGTWILGKYPFDVTAQKHYTLAQSSEEYIKALNQKVTLKLYISDNLEDYDWDLNSYTADVIGLLSRYSLQSDGKIKLEIRMVEENSPMALQAQKDGILLLSDGNKDYYFGMKAVFADGKSVTVPQFEPQRKNNLQSDLNQVLNIATQNKPAVGIISPEIPWFAENKNAQNHKIIDFLSAYYNLVDIPSNASYIPSDIEVLAVNNSGELNPLVAYAIDQYVMQGGKVVFLVDPYSETLHHFLGYPPRPKNYMSSYLEKWGVKYSPDLVRGSLKYGSKIKDIAGRNFVYPLWFFADAAESKNIYLKSAGSLEPLLSEQLKHTVLLESPEQGGFIQTAHLRYSPKHKTAEYFVDDDKKTALAMMVQGEFLSHYQSALNDNSEYQVQAYPYAPFSKKEATIVVIADSDFLNDSSWVSRFNPENPIYGTVAYSGNADFILKIINSLSQNIKLSTYENKYILQNTAEAFYEKSYRQYAQKFTDLENKIANLYSNINTLERIYEQNNSVLNKEKLSLAQDELREKEQELSALKKLIRKNADNLLYLFIVLNIIVFPTLLICGILIIIKTMRFLTRCKTFFDGEKL